MGEGATAGWQITGERGELQVGFQWAATVGQWTLTCSNVSLGSMDSILRARVESIDAYWSTQPPVRVRLWMGEAWWRWDKARLLAPIQVGGTVEIKLEGNPESIPG